MKTLTSIVAGILVGGLGLLASPAIAGNVELKSVNDPTWTVDGFVQFSAPIGTGDTGYAEFFETIKSIWPTSKGYRFNNDTLNAVEDQPRSGPYNNDAIDGVAAAGYKTGDTFTADDFSKGNSVSFAFMIVPGTDAPKGKSPSQTNGAIVPNSLFDLSITGLTKRDGVDFDPNWTFPYYDINKQQSVPAGTFDGYSHAPIIFAEAAEFGPLGTPASGNYTATWSFRDTGGAGWDITTHYTVAGSAEAVPLPPAALMALPLLGGLVLKLRKSRVSNGLDRDEQG